MVTNEQRLINALKAIHTTLKMILITLTIVTMITTAIFTKAYTSPDNQYVYLIIAAILSVTCASGIHKTIE